MSSFLALSLHVIPTVSSGTYGELILVFFHLCDRKWPWFCTIQQGWDDKWLIKPDFHREADILTLPWCEQTKKFQQYSKWSKTVQSSGQWQQQSFAETKNLIVRCRKDSAFQVTAISSAATENRWIHGWLKNVWTVKAQKWQLNIRCKLQVISSLCQKSSHDNLVELFAWSWWQIQFLQLFLAFFLFHLPTIFLWNYVIPILCCNISTTTDADFCGCSCQ